jgi:hypothetical protein
VTDYVPKGLRNQWEPVGVHKGERLNFREIHAQFSASMIQEDINILVCATSY